MFTGIKSPEKTTGSNSGVLDIINDLRSRSTAPTEMDTSEIPAEVYHKVLDAANNASVLIASENPDISELASLRTQIAESEYEELYSDILDQIDVILGSHAEV